MRSLRPWLGPALVGLVVVGFYFLVTGLYAAEIVSAYYLQILILICINTMLVVSLNLINGFTGQFSLGHAGFMAVGAYLSAALTKFSGAPFLVAVLAGACGSAVVGFLIGLPTLRLRGDYLAIATLGFGEVIRVVFFNLDVVGGPRGFMGIPQRTTFTWVYVFAILTVLVIRNFVGSTHGRACMGIREDEIAAETMGVNTTAYKVTAFTIGAFFAGAAGGLYAHYFMFIHPSSFTFLKSIEVLVMLVLGGQGSITGSVVAAAILTILPEALRILKEFRMVIYALLLILLMLFRPGGLFGSRELTLEGLLGGRSALARKEVGRNGAA